ncbi:MAG: DUF1353 domain-containing protein [Verrucomicrobiota bacterium]
MKIRLHHVLIACLLISGCLPAPQTGPQPGSSVRRQVAQHQKPEAPRLKRLANGHYKVRKPWTVDIGGRRWLVPAGYTSNGITAPARVKASLGDGVDHPETWAAVFHDWLFTQKGLTRAQADRIFHELLIAYGVPAGKAGLMHTIVSAYSVSKGIR